MFGERDGRQMTYVGHSVGGLFDKLCEHDRTDKNFWTEALLFTTADDSFSARELVWLEDKFVDELKSAGNFTVKIGNDERPDDIESCAEFACLAFCEINQKIFAPPKVEPPAAQDVGEIFYLKQNVKRLNREVNATMRCPTDKQCIVLKGSVICTPDKDNSPSPIQKRRRSVKIDVNGKLLEDVELNSPSAAAEFVTGNVSANGRTAWQMRDGVTFGQFFGR